MQIGVGKHDERGLAAQLEGDVLERLRRRRHHALARADLPGQRHLGDVRVRGQQPAGAAVALDHVEHARRQSCLGVDLGELQRGQRRELRRFEDHGIATGERRRGLPAGDLYGVVPGADARADAERLAPRVGEGTAEIVVMAVQRGGDPGEILEAIGAGMDVDGLRLADGLARVEDLEARELLIALAQEVRGAREYAPALHAGHRRPGAVTLRRRRDGALNVVFVGALHAAERLAGGRVDGREGLARMGLEIAATDEQALGFQHVHLPGSSARGLGGRAAYTLK